MKAVVSKYTVRVVYHFKAKGQGKKQVIPRMKEQKTLHNEKSSNFYTGRPGSYANCTTIIKEDSFLLWLYP